MFLGEAGVEAARLELRVLHPVQVFSSSELGFDIEPPAQSFVVLG